MKTTILFFGTPAFAVPILETLHRHFQVVGVVTRPDRPGGRKQEFKASPVKDKAKELKIPLYQPETPSEILELFPRGVDFIVTAAYGEYLPESVLRLPKKDALNVHPSLLPRYRGATPIQSALLNGDTKTGVSILRMAKRMDTGEVFVQEGVKIDPQMRYPELDKACARVGAELIRKVIYDYSAITPIKQEEALATVCKKMMKEEGQVRWEQETAHQIFNKLRAFTPWPGLYTKWKGVKLNLLDFSPLAQKKVEPLAPGSLFQEGGAVFVACREGALELKTVQLAGRTPTDIRAFLNGHLDFIGSTLEGA